ncbi:MAG: histidinol dehydrogenase [Ruminococcaceae bacterium]|nr:histidinol dehydrogenase [Oscillospiraceae bacterium]
MIRIVKQDTLIRNEVFRSAPPQDVTETVASILHDVEQRGDDALLDYTERFDGCRPSPLTVTPKEIENAFAALDSSFLAVIREAAANIREYHEKQLRKGYTLTKENGVITGQRIIPLRRVGLYVPGGTAAYPSTVLMDAIPAKVAGCEEIVIVTPPDRNGNIPPAILVAASIAGVDRIVKAGGAQAIAALAFGTESVPRVDKIAGPGNIYVAEAKRQVFGLVNIDMIAGPSEILIVSDAASDPRFLAADLLSQAEHDRNATAVLVTDSEVLASRVSHEIERQLLTLPRAAIARESIDKNGLIVVTSNLNFAIAMANEIAPEHLELAVDDPMTFLDRVKNAGSVFLGRYTPEAVGDYFAGPNHTLPTSGTARFSSPLSVDDFIKKSQFIYYSKEALADAYGKVALFAEEEGLSAHARSARIRFEEI